MNEQKISTILIEHGKRLFDASKAFIEFTSDNEAEHLLNDLEGYPHAFVLACVMDRQVRAEIAWMIPFKFQQKLGDFSISTLVSLSMKFNRSADVHIRRVFTRLGLACIIHKCCRALTGSFVHNEFLVGRPYAWLRSLSSESIANKVPA